MNSEMHSEAVIERVISVHPPSLLHDILGGSDRASLEMHLEAEIEWTERFTSRP